MRREYDRRAQILDRPGHPLVRDPRPEQALEERLETLLVLLGALALRLPFLGDVQEPEEQHESARRLVQIADRHAAQSGHQFLLVGRRVAGAQSRRELADLGDPAGMRRTILLADDLAMGRPQEVLDLLVDAILFRLAPHRGRDDRLQRVGRPRARTDMSDRPIKSLGLSPALHGYLVDHGSPPDAILSELIQVTRDRIGGLAMMQIPPEEGALLTLLARLIGARRAIEIGTFTGYSAICIARGLAPGGKLLCCDVSQEWTDIGRPFWKRAGVEDKIELRLAPALETLATLPADRSWDLAFIDAVKTEYWSYLEKLLGLLRPGGLVVVDNVLWSGSVIDEANQTPETRAIRAFNDRVAKDERFDRVMLGVGDGLTLLRVR